MSQKKTKKRLSQAELVEMCELLSERLEDLLHALGVEFVEYPNRYSFPCPVHSGDSPEGCTIFTDGDSSVGNWQCWTKHCEEEYNQSLFGFVRGALSAKEGRDLTMNQTFDYCLSFLGKNEIEHKPFKPTNKQTKLLDVFQKAYSAPEKTMSREDIRNKLIIPSQYYLDRGYQAETLDIFDVGDCREAGKPMNGRAVVPIYDIGSNFIGCVGRATNDKFSPKWLHSKGFKKNSLYGINIAKNHMSKLFKNPTLFILEGQGDVWRMYEAGYKNSVSIFGSSLSDDQLVILEEVGVMNLVVMTDYDDAGNKAADQIVKICGRRFNYLRPQISAKDPGDLSIEQLKDELDPQLERFKK